MLGEIYSAETLTTIKEILDWKKKKTIIQGSELSVLDPERSKCEETFSLKPHLHQNSSRSLNQAFGFWNVKHSLCKDKRNPAFSQNSEALLRAALPTQNWSITYVTCGRGVWNNPAVKEGRKGGRIGETGKQKKSKKERSKLAGL